MVPLLTRFILVDLSLMEFDRSHLTGLVVVLPVKCAFRNAFFWSLWVLGWWLLSFYLRLGQSICQSELAVRIILHFERLLNGLLRWGNYLAELELRLALPLSRHRCERLNGCHLKSFSCPRSPVKCFLQVLRSHRLLLLILQWALLLTTETYWGQNLNRP